MSKIVTYDLRAPGRDYKSLISEIEKYDVWAKITESCYMIGTSETCVALRDKLKSHMDSNDRLFVGELTKNAAWFNVLCKNQYLKDHL